MSCAAPDFDACVFLSGTILGIALMFCVIWIGSRISE